MVGQGAPEHTEQVRRAFGDPTVYLRERSHQVRIRGEAVAQMIAGSARGAPRRILDVGCGDGSISIPLLREDTRVTLLDLSPGMLEVARAHVPPEFADAVELLQGTLDTYDARGEKMDLVLCLGLMAHLREPLAIVPRLASLLAPDGMLILQHTDASHPVGRVLAAYSRLRHAVNADRHPWSRVTDRDVARACDAEGLRSVATFSYGFFPGLEQRLWPRHAYQLERALFGQVDSNRSRWLGTDRITAWTRRD